MKIPKIIHQVGPMLGSSRAKVYKPLMDTWKRDYPDWTFIYWDDEAIEEFVAKTYPDLLETFHLFPFDVQRWDAIRYLILYTMGGMYVDCDYESVESMCSLFEDCECAFSLEPDTHVVSHRHLHDHVFNNALMVSVPHHPFMKKIIESVFSKETLTHETINKDICVYETTGPWKLVDLYSQLPKEEKEQIYLIPAKYVTPFDIPQAIRFKTGEISDELEQCLDEAYAVHYFFGNWRFDNH